MSDDNLVPSKRRRKRTSLKQQRLSRCASHQPPLACAGRRPRGAQGSKAQQNTRRSPCPRSGPSECLGQQEPAKTLDRPSSPPSKRRKRAYEADDIPTNVASEHPAKRLRIPADRAASKFADLDPLDYWLREKTWPREYFEPDTMSHLLVRKGSTPSLRRKRSDNSIGASFTTPSDQKPRAEKSAPYADVRYRSLLETKGSFMREDEQGPKRESKELCRDLLARDQEVPSNSRFSENVFKTTCQRIQERNEAKVIQDITRLIVPSAEELADFGAEPLKCLIESVNEGWNNSVPLTRPRPQPDYSVGFKRTAFSDEQQKKILPFIGNFLSGDQCFFMSTFYMYFPFLSCEVKCGAAALDIADRQNAHSMTLAVRAIVELFRLVGREAEVNREILAFSVSHSDSSVRIYGHYAVVKGKDTTFYRYPIHKFDFTILEGREKWTSYKFIKNVYEEWVPTHFERLCSVIDQLPLDVDFEVSSAPQDLELDQLSQSLAESASQAGYDDDGLDDGVITPSTSFTGQGNAKRPRRKGAR